MSTHVAWHHLTYPLFLLTSFGAKFYGLDHVLPSANQQKYSRLHLSRLHLFCIKAQKVILITGSWFIPRERRIGRHDSSSSSCPPQPLQPRPSWCPFSWGPSERLPVLSRSTWPPPETLGGSYWRACRGIPWWSMRERCPSHSRRLYRIIFSAWR